MGVVIVVFLTFSVNVKAHNFPPSAYPCSPAAAWAPAFPQPFTAGCYTNGPDGIYVLGSNPSLPLCCTTATSNLPDAFPDIDIPVKIATFEDCAVSAEQIVDLEFRSVIPTQWQGSALCKQQFQFKMFLKAQGLRS